MAVVYLEKELCHTSESVNFSTSIHVVKVFNGFMKLLEGTSSKFCVFITATVSKLKNPTDNASKDYQELFLVKLILIFGFKVR